MSSKVALVVFVGQLMDSLLQVKLQWVTGLSLHNSTCIFIVHSVFACQVQDHSQWLCCEMLPPPHTLSATSFLN